MFIQKHTTFYSFISLVAIESLLFFLKFVQDEYDTRYEFEEEQNAIKFLIEEFTLERQVIKEVLTE